MTDGLTRRGVLALGAAAATAAAVPPALSLPVSAPTVKPATTIWVGGTDGEMDWHCFDAKSEADAMKQLLRYHDVPDGETRPYLQVQRAPSMDGLRPREIGRADWIRARLGTLCDRCDDECFGDNNGRVIAGEVVCDECLTIADKLQVWRADDVEDELAEILIDQDGDLAAAKVHIGSSADVVTDEMWARVVARRSAIPRGGCRR